MPLSALQHFLFCERQCAFIHVEQVWMENLYTIEGELLHHRAHSGSREARPGKKTEFGMPIRSLELGLSGKTDAVEYGADGSVLVVEYKRGRPKAGGMDEVQLCAQALCLEEMRGQPIAEGALYYGKTRRRKPISFDTQLRERTAAAAARLHELVRAGRTPLPVYNAAKCTRCSLAALCMPKRLGKAPSVELYFSRMLREEASE
ncbi:MAG: CRISPR-associated protein Cas4 [Spirochaetes bacterium]|nr:CRISPR-associated protein Cas4 [Spirochaetota bacterium]